MTNHKLMRQPRGAAFVRAACIGVLLCAASLAQEIDLTGAVVVTRSGTLPNAEAAAAQVLTEELQKRAGVHLAASKTWPQDKPVIAIASQANVSGWPRQAPQRTGSDLPEHRAEGYRLHVDCASGPRQIVWITGADARGALFGVGQFLRSANWAGGKLSISCSVDVATAPAYPIRGHQLGYRAQANSYDAWNQSTFDQYVRELAFFGINSIESIPFHDDRKTPVMKVSRREMNRALSESCWRYGLDYWAWIPADFNLGNEKLRSDMLGRIDEHLHDAKEFTGIFFPGGDPGHNPPELVLPFLSDVGKRMAATHPKAKVWLSLQWFNAKQIDYIYDYISREKPTWLGGLVAGPSSPALSETRRRLPKQYPLRDYPDLTHNKLAQYEVPSWDQSFARTLGREAINPRAAEYAAIHNRYASYTNGFISYSDGVHDDVNKTIWSAMSWDPSRKTRDILKEYAHVYFSPRVSDRAADGILALENNWRGILVDNGAVEGTLLYWKQLEKDAPELAGNWRWQMCLVRAYYDAYIRRRLIHETSVEDAANAILADAGKLGSGQAIQQATELLNRPWLDADSAEIRARILDLCDRLFRSIGLQTSVEKYHAIGAERGAILDFVDLPLNNRWWLEDQFKKIGSLASEREKVERLHTLATWEHPGPGSFYDAVGDISRSPHVVRVTMRPKEGGLVEERGTTFWWWNEGKSRARLSWQATMWPEAVVYEGVDPAGSYVVRSTGYGQALLRINGERVTPTVDGRELGEFKEWKVPASALRDRKLTLTWDHPTGEEELNWRNKSRLSEVWLLKK